MWIIGEQGPGQVGLYELPTIISQVTQMYDFYLLDNETYRSILQSGSL